MHFSWFFHVRFSFSAGYGQFPVVCALALGGSYGSMTARSQGEISVFFAGRVSKFVPKNTEVSRKAAITFGALTVVALISIILM